MIVHLHSNLNNHIDEYQKLFVARFIRKDQIIQISNLFLWNKSKAIVTLTMLTFLLKL